MSDDFGRLSNKEKVCESLLTDDLLECAQLAAALGLMGKFFGVTGKGQACLPDHGEAASQGKGDVEGLEQQAAPFRRVRELWSR